RCPESGGDARVLRLVLHPASGADPKYAGLRRKELRSSDQERSGLSAEWLTALLRGDRRGAARVPLGAASPLSPTLTGRLWGGGCIAATSGRRSQHLRSSAPPRKQANTQTSQDVRFVPIASKCTAAKRTAIR